MKHLIISLSILCSVLLGIVSLIVFELPPFKKLQDSNNIASNGKTSLNELDSLKNQKEVPLTYTERIEKGDVLSANKYYTLAIKEYSIAYELAPDKVEPLIKIGKIHYDIKAYQKAIENFQNIIKEFPNNIEARINLIRSLIDSENWQSAKEEVNKLPEDNQIAVYFKGLLAVYEMKNNDSTKYFSKVKEINTTQDINDKAEKYLSAYKIYEQLSDPQEEYLQTLLAKSANENEDYMLASYLLKKVTQKLTDYRDAWILYGYANLKLENYQNAIENFEKALALDTEKPETRYLLGLAYFALDNYQSAITNLEIALKNGYEPKTEIYQKLAELYLMIKDYESSNEYFEKTLENEDENIDYYIRPIWNLIENLKSPEKCLKLASQAIIKHPDQAMSYNLQGWCYLGGKKYSDAKNNFEKALMMDPKLSAAYLNLGKLHQEQGNQEKAKENYKKAYDIDPKSPIGNLAANQYNKLLVEN